MWGKDNAYHKTSLLSKCSFIFYRTKLALYILTSLAYKSSTQKMFQAHYSTGRLARPVSTLFKELVNSWIWDCWSLRGRRLHASLSYTNTIWKERCFYKLAFSAPSEVSQTQFTAEAIQGFLFLHPTENKRWKVNCMLLSWTYNEQKYHPYESFAYTAVITVTQAMVNFAQVFLSNCSFWFSKLLRPPTAVISGQWEP